MFSGINQNGAETFRFRNLEAITDKEVEKLLLEISSKVLKRLKKHSYLNHDGFYIDLKGETAIQPNSSPKNSQKLQMPGKPQQIELR